MKRKARLMSDRMRGNDSSNSSLTALKVVTIFRSSVESP